VTDQPVAARHKWMAITVGTLLLHVSYWAILVAFVSAAAGQGDPGPALAVGAAVAPFVFVALAFLSRHANPGKAVLSGMGLLFVVGFPLLAFMGDAVTGTIAGYGAGGVAALRPEPGLSWRPRALAVVVAGLLAAVLVRLTTVGLLLAPLLPLTGLGVADALAARDEPPAAG
jgi:hypothetical protein